ncbi:hypothetical protein [Dyadobacter sp. CY343]|uniref:hypothetical protein n=1 Tax=Dyadobacter sp. CY343 TaxID=2907299 RepID=UPI001F1E29BF|nr:hypothetical protein [Dyadobacter sp. CY343]MCE7062654.1 hypothetical protein [Dyadobacter sp. CY343]
MKLLVALAVCGAFLALFAGCEKERLMPRQSWGHFRAKVNGRNWEHTYRNAFQAVRAKEEYVDSTCKRMVIYSLLFDSGGDLEEELYFTNIPTKTGRYKIMPNRHYSCEDSTFIFSQLVAFTNFDMFRDPYEVVESEDNYLQIDQFQENGNREIKGRFNVTYVLRSPRSANSHEDTLRFTNGTFHTKILTPGKGGLL